LIFIIAWDLSKHETGTVHLQFSYFTGNFPFLLSLCVLLANLCSLVLGYWGLAFYFLLSALHTFTYALHGGTPLLNRLPRPLQALHHLFHTTITTFPLLVTIAYWTLLYSPYTTHFDLWSNISQHALNSAFALFEILFTRINPAPWIHLPFLVLLLACYIGLAYLTHCTKGVYVYHQLDPDPPNYVDGENIGGVGKGIAAGYVLGMVAGLCLLFCVVKGLARLRKWVTETKMELSGKFYGRRKLGQAEVDLETQRAWGKS
jgi:hypothetical protein